MATYAFLPSAHRRYLLQVLNSATAATSPSSSQDTEIATPLPLLKDTSVSIETVLGGAYWTFAALSLLQTETNTDNSCQTPHALLHTQHKWLNSPQTYVERSAQQSILAVLHALELCILQNTLHTIDSTYLKELFTKLLLLQNATTGTFRDLPETLESQATDDMRLTFAALLCVGILHIRLKTEAAKDTRATSANIGTSTLRKDDSSTVTGESLENTRFSLQGLHTFNGVVNQLHYPQALLKWILDSQNLDGGFGGAPQSESHAGLTFCALGCLALLNKLESLGYVPKRRLMRWLSERQLPNGGMNGRPGKAVDVCYSFWVVASFKLLETPLSNVVRVEALIQSIYSSQHPHTGGFSKHPYSNAETSVAVKPNVDDTDKENATSLNAPDVFHTFFALAALSLLAFDKPTFQSSTHSLRYNSTNAKHPQCSKHSSQEALLETICEIHPLFALPKRCIEKNLFRNYGRSAWYTDEEEK